MLIACILAAAAILLSSSTAYAGGAFQPLEWSAQIRQVVLLLALGGLAFSLRSL